MIRKKICMLGAYAVGKTSLVRRFVKDIFSERYETTIGVKILKKDLEIGGVPITLLLWDLHGEDDFQDVRTSYLRGSSGYILVADGTRADTLDTAGRLHDLARENLGAIPFVLLLNKSDLRGEWELGEAPELAQFGDAAQILHTSAKTGDGVEAAFHTLARTMVTAE